MTISDYFTSDRQEHWREQIGKSDWRAGQFLYQLLCEGRLQEHVGEAVKLLLLTDGDELVSFCTLAPRDDVPDCELTPWIGFVYTFPRYRGQRLMGRLLRYAEEAASAAGWDAVYISTDHVGLYEKYGYTFHTVLRDLRGDETRVYRKTLREQNTPGISTI